jgi:hypothetical protein
MWENRKQRIAKRIAARTSVKRIVKNELGLKAPRGYGWITNPKKFLCNKVLKYKVNLS